MELLGLDGVAVLVFPDISVLIGAALDDLSLLRGRILLDDLSGATDDVRDLDAERLTLRARTLDGVAVRMDFFGSSTRGLSRGDT